MINFVQFLVTIAKPFVRPFFPVKILGPRKFPQRKTLLVSNHLSGWDPVVFQIWSKSWISYVYKAEFRKSPFLRWIFDGLDLIPVHRGEVDLNASKTILRNLRDGKIVGLFPEGTRNPNIDSLQEFHTGAALFAIKTQSPIRPYYIWDKMKACHKNYILIGDEFTLEEYYGKPITKELLEEATQKVRQKVDELRIRLNAIMEKKGIKRRKLTKKEIERVNEYNERQKTLAKELAKKAQLEQQQQGEQQQDEQPDERSEV